MFVIIPAIFLIELGCGVEESTVVLGVNLLQVFIELKRICMLEQDGSKEGRKKTVCEVKSIGSRSVSKIKLIKDKGEQCVVGRMFLDEFSRSVKDVDLGPFRGLSDDERP